MKLEGTGLGIARGMALTLKHLFRKKVSTQYPEKKLETSRRIRGQQFVWKADMCTGCATCAKSCPHGIIRITTSKNGENKYKVDNIEFDIGRCMFCGLCVEACPYSALFMGRGYEVGSYRRKLLWADMEQLMSPDNEASSYGHPEMDEKLPLQTLLVYGQISKDTADKNVS